MIRLIGVITGSALAIGLLLLLLGVPELGGEPPAERSDMAVADATTAPPGDAPRVQAPEPAAEAEPVAVPEPVAEAEPVAPPAPSAEPEPVIDAAAPAMQEPVAQDENIRGGAAGQSEVREQHWYAFWSPFRSRIAADGFVSELSRTTGLDYRVVKLKPGVFEVAVAYTDDADIEDKLARISAATGLEMSGG